MASIFDIFKKVAPAPKANPFKMSGAPGRAIYGGYVQTNESSPSLQGAQKYVTYSDILANTSIVAAGVRYFLNLTASADWIVSPSEDDKDGRYADLASAILFDDPETSWPRIVRRAAMFRFYGFSIQEWQAVKHKKGHITLKDIAPRAQRTIERWEIAEDGTLLGAWQKSPQTQFDLYLPRSKLLYLVDDTLEDSPEGIGLFRHLSLPAERLRRYEQLEGYGFETDLRGVPIGRGPFTKLAEMEEAGELSRQDRIAIEAPMRAFIENHIKGPKLGLLLDSQPYESLNEAATPSNVRQWDVDLLKAGSSSLPEMANAIGRLNREMARILGVEQLLLGESSTGSYALGANKTQSFFLLVDGTIKEIIDTVKRDILKTIWTINGFDEKYMPRLTNTAIRFQDIESTTQALRDMAAAGAILMPDDPAIIEIREFLGLSPPPENGMLAVNAAVTNVPHDGDNDTQQVGGTK